MVIRYQTQVPIMALSPDVNTFIEDSEGSDHCADSLDQAISIVGAAGPFPDFQKRAERPLSKIEVERYGRQLILPDLGASGQRKLIAGSVLMIGAGGLASSAAMYLAGAGVGIIGIVDFDDIEISNLQRQIIHKAESAGKPKVISAAQAINAFNPQIKVYAYHCFFSAANALAIIKPYDLVIDCTDNVVSRYLINDACVLSGKSLISGSALRFEGQITVYNFGESGPCYRCIFKQPPPKEAQGNCSSDGVLGVVPGIIGSLQALEAIRILATGQSQLSGRLQIFDGISMNWRSFKLRAKDPNCAICGSNPSIKELIDYEKFCGATANDKPVALALIPSDQSITVEEYSSIFAEKKAHLLLDVRPRLHFDICALPGAVNIPLSELDGKIEYLKQESVLDGSPIPIYVICRRGNDSQRACIKLQSNGITNFKNIAGGITAWAKQVDAKFPIY